jgi:hypothetical protein
VHRHPDARRHRRGHRTAGRDRVGADALARLISDLPLTDLKSSKSTISTPNGSPERRATRNARSISSSKRRRFANPVSGSVDASRSS